MSPETQKPEQKVLLSERWKNYQHHLKPLRLALG